MILTHSPLMVDWHDIKNGARVVRVHKRAGQSVVSQPSREILCKVAKLVADKRNPHALGTNANEALFLRDGIIVVEGQEDVSLYPEVASQLGMKISGTFYGWGAGGLFNVPTIMRLLGELGYERVAGLIDSGHSEDVLVTNTRNEFPKLKIFQIPAGDIRDKKRFRRVRGTDHHVLEPAEGLLDENWNVRDKYKGKTRVVLEAVNQVIDGVANGEQITV